jgi:hypothetical protein
VLGISNVEQIDMPHLITTILNKLLQFRRKAFELTFIIVQYRAMPEADDARV